MSEKAPYAPPPMHDELSDEDIESALDREDSHDELNFDFERFPDEDYLDGYVSGHDDNLFEGDDWEDDL